MKAKIFLILHNIRSVHNVGSIFRTADAVGVSKIFLTGYTPAPTDRFGRARKDLAKVALGAEKSVPWEQGPGSKLSKLRVLTIGALISKLKRKKIKIVALEQASRSVDYRKFQPKFPLALILGNEVSGIPKSVLDKCDSVIEIPMRGRKESLNVSVAAGVALFKLLE